MSVHYKRPNTFMQRHPRESGVPCNMKQNLHTTNPLRIPATFQGTSSSLKRGSPSTWQNLRMASVVTNRCPITNDLHLLERNVRACRHAVKRYVFENWSLLRRLNLFMQRHPRESGDLLLRGRIYERRAL